MGMAGKALQSFHSKLLSGLIRAVMLQTNGEAMQIVYDKIKNEGIEYFGFADIKDPDYFYFKPDYEDFEAIKSGTLPEFLMFKYRKKKRADFIIKAGRSAVLKFALQEKLRAFCLQTAAFTIREKSCFILNKKSLCRALLGNRCK